MKKNIFLVTLLFLNSALVGESLMAQAPQKYSKCERIVNMPENSQGHFFDEACKLYVLPPSIGKVSISNYTMTVDPYICEGINSTTQGILNQMSSLKNTTMNKEALKNLIEEKAQLKEELNIQTKKLIVVNKKMEEAIIKENELQDKISAAEKTLEDCKLESKKCSLEDWQLKNSKTSLDLFRKNNLNKLKIYKAQLAQTIEQKKAQIGYLDEKLSNSTNNETIKKLEDLEDKLLSIYKGNQKTEGGKFQIIFENKLADLIKNYQRLNPHLVIEPMPVNVSLDFSIQNVDDQRINLPSVLSQDIPGTSHILNEDYSSPATGNFSGAASGQVVLNATSACSIYNTGKTVSNTDLLSSLTSHLVANARFQYQLQIGRSYSVTVNEKELYSMIKNLTTKEGLFNPKSSIELNNYFDSSSSVDVNFSSNDIYYNWPDNFDFKVSIKNEVLDRALSKLEPAYLLGVPDLPVVPKASSPELSETIQKNCANKWCHAAGILLKVGQGLFGSQESSVKFIDSLSASATETFNDKKMIYQYGSFSFKPE